MVGAALLIVGFANAADFGFGGPTSYAFIVSGGVVIIGAIVHSLTTTRNAIIPPVSTAWWCGGGCFQSLPRVQTEA
jgi:hypothetical protein